MTEAKCVLLKVLQPGAKTSVLADSLSAKSRPLLGC